MKISNIIMFSCTAAMAAVCLSFTAGAADDVAIDETNFPDETLRGYISENYDTDKNGSLSAKETENAEELMLENIIYDEDGNLIMQQLDLTGINYLKKLKNINICGYNVINADISGIEALTDIGFSGGDISGLVLGDMSSLEACDIYNSDLTELSLPNCPNLVQCYFEYNPKLARIEIKNAAILRFLGCRNNALVNLKIENCTGLDILDCQNNRLTKLDITNCPNLAELACSGNMIAQLDITPYKDLIANIKEYDGLIPEIQMQRQPPLIVDSGTKVIYNDETESENAESAVESDVNSKPQETKNSNTIMLVIILAAVVIAGASAAVIISIAKGGKEK